MTPFDYHTSATCAVRSTGWRIRTCHRGRSELSRELVEPLRLAKYSDFGTRAHHAVPLQSEHGSCHHDLRDSVSPYPPATRAHEMLPGVQLAIPVEAPIGPEHAQVSGRMGPYASAREKPRCFFRSGFRGNLWLVDKLGVCRGRGRKGQSAVHWLRNEAYGRETGQDRGAGRGAAQ